MTLLRLRWIYCQFIYTRFIKRNEAVVYTGRYSAIVKKYICSWVTWVVLFRCYNFHISSVTNVGEYKMCVMLPKCYWEQQRIVSCIQCQVEMTDDSVHVYRLHLRDAGKQACTHACMRRMTKRADRTIKENTAPSARRPAVVQSSKTLIEKSIASRRACRLQAAIVVGRPRWLMERCRAAAVPRHRPIPRSARRVDSPCMSGSRRTGRVCVQRSSTIDRLLATDAVRGRAIAIIISPTSAAAAATATPPRNIVYACPLHHWHDDDVIATFHAVNAYTHTWWRDTSVTATVWYCRYWFWRWRTKLAISNFRLPGIVRFFMEL